MGWKHGTDVGSIPKSRLLTSRLDRVPWKATDEERTMPLPGDDLVPSPLVETTYAVTIHAAPEQVWSWLVQLGHGRAGFYSDSRFWDRCVDWYYRLLSREQLGEAPVGYRVEVADRVVPAWQNPHVGDIVADGPPGTAYYVVRQVEPNKAFRSVHGYPPAASRAGTPSGHASACHLRRDQ